MRWKVEFYDAKVMKNIEQWPVRIGAKFTQIVDLIEEFGPEGVGMPHKTPQKEIDLARKRMKEVKDNE